MEPIGILRKAKQGFVTENGYFVDRKIGLCLAKYFNQIDTLLKEKNIKDSKKITIHCNSNLIEKLFINLSEFMSKNNSGIPIDVIPLDDDKTLDTLLSNNLDDYILTICSEHQRFPNNTQLSHLAQSKTFLAVSPNIKHSFKKILSIQDLLEIPLIIPQKKYSFQQYWSKKLEENGHPKIVYSSPDAKSINILANKGLGGILYLDFNYFRTPTNLFLIPIKNSPTFYVTLLCSSKKEQNEISFLKSIIMQ